MKCLLIIIAAAGLLFSQSYEIERTGGTVRYLTTKDNSWQELKTRTTVAPNTIISTEKGSSVRIKGENILFTLKEFSAVSVSNIRKMNTDELLLALAMEKVMSAPRKNNGKKSESTSVYGTNVNAQTLTALESPEFGFKRLNGARQLAESGLIESAIITAGEVYRKYPAAKKEGGMRIYFAGLLYQKGLYEEALEEYSDIKKLPLTKEQETEVDARTEEINKLLLKSR